VSAICGVVGLDGRTWSETDLAAVVQALTPLGPDGGGTWSGTAGRCGVVLAAALRQSTPQDAGDRQPASDPGGRVVLVGDMRLDDRDAVAAQLGLSGPASLPDSALALAAYDRWKEGMLDRLTGEFALAVVDRRRGGVLLARDHAGCRPLVVHERRGVVAFASTALALTGFPGVGHELDRDRAAEVLALVLEGERTFVRGVRWLEPGAALWINDAGVRRWRWWRPERVEVLDEPAAVHERELRTALDAAVAAGLRTRGAVGAMVSGGLDSASVAATAARALDPATLRTYTSAPSPEWPPLTREGWDPDETALVGTLAARHPNLASQVVHVPPGSGLFDRHLPLWELGAAPPRNPCNWLWSDEIYRLAAADGVTALLVGHRGNLFFSADGASSIAALLRRGRVADAAREARAWSRASGAGAVATLRRDVVAPFLPGRARRVLRVLRRRPPAAREWQLRTPLRPDAAADVDLQRLPWLDERRRADPGAVALADLRAIATQAEGTAAQTALTGVEERDPTIDRRVVETALRQPEWLRRRGGVTRAVARGAMADRLPPAILGRTARGEQLPDWLDVLTAARGELAAELERVADHPTSRELIDVERLRGLLGRWPAPSQGADPTVIRDYRIVLLRGLLIGRYLRWFEEWAAAGPRPPGPVRVSAGA
jgi:asparagine synthase (glutamine-hydrolysing)